jgi:cyclopropane fatty-acyl-phospholipid synthase-like methyltransferase
VDEETLQFYRGNAQAYARREIAAHTRLTRFLALLAPGAAILELGCGAGAASTEMLTKGFEVRPTDGSPEMAREASQRLGRPVETLRCSFTISTRSQPMMPFGPTPVCFTFPGRNSRTFWR